MEPLDQTFHHLADVENEAAVGVLMLALDSRTRSIADRALQAVLRRQTPGALDELVRRWHLLPERWKQAIAQRPGVLKSALRSAFQSSHEPLIRNAAAAIIDLADYDLAPTLAHAASDSLPLRRKLAGEVLLRLAERLCEELHGQTRLTARHDPQCTRGFFVGCLETAASQFPQHHSREILEAFLLTVSRECATLRHLLQDPQEPAHGPLCEQLVRSTRPGVVQLLLSFIDDPHAPLAALRVLGRRRDVGYFRQLCSKVAEEHSIVTEKNLGRIEELSWADTELTILSALAETDQPGAVLIVASSKLSMSQKQRVLEHILHRGHPLGRSAAANALFELYRGESEWLLDELIHDPCPLVQAEAVLNLKSSDYPDALNTLISLLDSPHEIVREAARSSLPEFRFASYLAAFDGLSDDARKFNGQLMRKIDFHAIELLGEEITASGRSRRLRALQIASVLDCAAEVHAALVVAGGDESEAVRVAVAQLLSGCENAESRAMLRRLLTDSSSAVQRAAEQSLRHLNQISDEAEKLAMEEVLV